MPSLDALYAEWEATQSVRATLQVLEALRGQGATERVSVVCRFATTSMWSNVPILVLAGRVYLEDGRLSEAQSTLVAAGKLAPQNAEVYRWLGEVLIARNDNERAIKVLERAAQFGGDPKELRVLFARAKGETPPPPSGRPLSSSKAPPPTPAPAPVESVTAFDVRSKPAHVVERAAPPSFSPPAPVARSVPAPAPARSERPAVPAPVFSSPPPAAALPKPATAAITGANPFATSPDISSSAHFFKDDAEPSFDLPRASVPPPVPNRAPAPRAPAPLTEDDFSNDGRPRVLDPREVLNALALAGVYDASEGPKDLQWDRPKRAPLKRSSLGVLAGTLVVLIVGIGGAFFYVRDQREKARVESERILAKVDADLKLGRLELLPESETTIGRAFELDSRSPHAATTWMKERAVLGLVKGGTDVAFEEAISRAKEVGVPDSASAFAVLASYLFQGDTSGAAAVLPKWDKAAERDPYYQLLAGTVLERIGDAHAIERYKAALALDPDFVMAEVAALRAIVLDTKQTGAKEAVAAFRTKQPARPEGAALVALMWGRETGRDHAPGEVDETVKRAAELPLSLRMVPNAASALKAIGDKKFDVAKTELAEALRVATDPSAATWLGHIALETGDEALARKAALAAVTFSAVYPPARVLAARVALLGNRLDEALKATEDLDARDPEVALVRAVVAYERLDLDGLGTAVESVSDENKGAALSTFGFAKPALTGGARMSGDKLVSLAATDAPWSDILAADMALDIGDLVSAKTITSAWASTDSRPSRAVRLSRLARYLGQRDEADKWSKLSLSQGSVTLRALIERTFVLVALGKAHDVTLLVKSYPAVFGPLAKWASAYAVASSGKTEEARAKVATEDPPPTLAPYPSRIIALAAMGALHDLRRGNPYIRPMLVDGLTNPDVADVVDQFHMPPIRKNR